MAIRTCPECHRGFMEEEKHCPACGADLLASRASKTWLRQIKVYIAVVMAGIMMLALTMPRLMHTAHDAAPDTVLVAIAIAGGLATLGGLFGLAIAIFFYYLWKKKTRASQ